MIEDVASSVDWRKALGSPRELRSKNGYEAPLELRQLVRLRRAAEMARAQPSGKPAVGDVRRVRPIEVGPFQIERLGDRPQIALVVDRVRGGEGAVDVENGELARGEIPLWWNLGSFFRRLHRVALREEAPDLRGPVEC